MIAEPQKQKHTHTKKHNKVGEVYRRGTEMIKGVGVREKSFGDKSQSDA